MSKIPSPRTSLEGSASIGFSAHELNYLSSLLDDSEREYIDGYYRKFRESNKAATEASNKWVARNDYLNDYCEVNHYSEHQKREKKGVDYALNDAMDAWSWHAREAARCENAISMVLKMKILTGGHRAG